MGTYNQMKITEKGSIYLAKIKNNECDFVFVRAETGAGTYAENEDLTLKTALKDSRQTFEISSCSRENEELLIKFVVDNSIGLSDGYTIQEVGLYVYDPEDGVILYGIATAKYGDYIAATSETTSTVMFNIKTKIDSSSTKVVIQHDTDAYVRTDDIVNDLSTKEDTIGKVLDARVGAVLHKRVKEVESPEFVESSSRENIKSGEKLSEILGKIKKWYTEIKKIAFSGNYEDIQNMPTTLNGYGITDAATKEHNHEDINNLINGLNTRLNALADSDDTTLDQLSEIVEYIKSNRTLIENVTTKKVNVADIIDTLTSTEIDKPLSAKQGKILKDLVDKIIANDLNSMINNLGVGEDIPTDDSFYISQHANGGENKSYYRRKTSKLWEYIKTKTDTLYAKNSHTHMKSDVGLENVGNFKSVSTSSNQGLTDKEKENARSNIGAGTSSFSGSYNDLSNKPTIPSNTWRGIQDNLKSTSTTDSLSANQGRILKNQLDIVSTNVIDALQISSDNELWISKKLQFALVSETNLQQKFMIKEYMDAKGDVSEFKIACFAKTGSYYSQYEIAISAKEIRDILNRGNWTTLVSGYAAGSYAGRAEVILASSDGSIRLDKLVFGNTEYTGSNAIMQIYAI